MSLNTLKVPNLIGACPRPLLSLLLNYYNYEYFSYTLTAFQLLIVISSHTHYSKRRKGKRMTDSRQKPTV